VSLSVPPARARELGQDGLGSPTLKAQLLCMLYEGVLLFGVVMLTGLAYALVTQQRHALVGSTGLKLCLFLVIGQYFVYFWTRSGQTLAMLTWHIKLTRVDGSRLGLARAWLRYGLCWLWFLPALATLHLAALKGSGITAAVVLVGVLAYAGLSRLHPKRQYLHDSVCQTRLVRTLPAK
jgi:uncharacterized RDD family membrane protein YckC